MNNTPLLETSYDKIVAHCLDPENSPLSERNQVMFNRWSAADDLLRRYPRDKQAMTMLRKKFPTISQQTAYRDLENAKKLFNFTNPVDKEFIRRWVIQDCLSMIEITKGMGARGLKAWNDARMQLIKAAKLEELEQILPNPDILESHQFFTVINIDGRTMKLDLDAFNSLPTSTKKELADLIHGPITEDQAGEIMES